jgi:cytochrome c
MNALRYAGVLAGVAMLAACSGGSETPKAEEEAAAPAADAGAETPAATPAAAEAPAADNTDTQEICRLHRQCR